MVPRPISSLPFCMWIMVCMPIFPSDLLIVCLIASTRSFLCSPTRSLLFSLEAEMPRSRRRGGKARNTGENVETVRDEGKEDSLSSPSHQSDPWSGEPLQLERVPQDALNSQFQPYMLILVGLPGSGKSTFALALESAMPFKVRENAAHGATGN